MAIKDYTILYRLNKKDVNEVTSLDMPDWAKKHDDQIQIVMDYLNKKYPDGDVAYVGHFEYKPNVNK